MAEQHSQTEDYETPFKFNGKELDSETGYYYYGARYYDPKNSIWLSIDPLMEEYPNVNPYVYCLQNPINLVDPDGKEVKGKSPIFDSKTGKLLGVDSEGYFGGEVLFMDSSKFQELKLNSENGIIDHADAVKNSTSIADLPNTAKSMSLFFQAVDKLSKIGYKHFYGKDPSKFLAGGKVSVSSNNL